MATFHFDHFVYSDNLGHFDNFDNFGNFGHFDHFDLFDQFDSTYEQDLMQNKHILLASSTANLRLSALAVRGGGGAAAGEPSASTPMMNSTYGPY